MTLTTENLGDMPDVDATTLDDVLTSDGFGNFAVLSASEEAFIQAGNAWQPGEECAGFLRVHDSDPWVLEYRDCGRQFRAAGHVTLEQVRQAFRSFLAGDSQWRTGLVWGALDV
jgi:hypothetical protein